MIRTPAPRNRPRIKLFILLAGIFVILNAVSVGLVGLVSFVNGQKAVTDIANRLTAESRERIQDKLSTFLDTPRHINQINAELISRGYLHSTEPGEMERHFWRQIARYEGISSIYFGYAEGGLSDAGQNPTEGSRYILATPERTAGPLLKFATDATGHRAGQLLRVPHFDARTRPWYREAVARGTTAWSAPYVLSTGQDMAIAVSRPVSSTDGELLGVVSVDIFLSDLSRFLNSLDLGQTGEAFLLDHNGYLIASSLNDQPLLETPAGAAPGQILARNSDSRIIRATAAALENSPGSLSGRSGPMRLHISGEPHYLRISPLHSDADLDWRVAVVIPERAFMAQIQANNRLTLIWILVACLLTSLVGIFFARKITRPVAELSLLADALSRGERLPAHAPATRISELDRLGRSFVHMAEQVRSKIAELTEQIELSNELSRSLKQSEQKYRTVIDHQQDALLLHKVVADGYAPFAEVNATAVDFYDYPREELLAMRISDLIVPEMLEHHQDNADRERLLEQGRLVLTSVHLTRTGRRIPVEVSASLVELRGENYILSSVRDISKRKQAEEALSLSNEILRKLATTANDAIIQMDHRGRVIFWNRAASRIFGYSASEAMDSKVHDLLAPKEALEQFTAAFPEFLIQGQGPAVDRVMEIEARHKKGHSVTVELSLSGFRYRQNWHAMGIIRDISERKKAEAERQRLEEELRQKYKMEAVGVMAGGIAHNFNNNLAIILGNIELAQRNPSRPEKIHEMLANAKTAVLRSRDLIQQILTYSRQGTHAKEAIRLAMVIDETRNLLRSTLPATVTLDYQVAESDRGITVHADSGRIQEALINLCTNAVQAMNEEGTLTIILDRVKLEQNRLPAQFDCTPGCYARLQVRDTGVGIDKAHLGKIFDPFFTTKGIEQGTGMGLATVQGIVENHQGAIEVTSSRGSGTTFTLYFPQVSPVDSTVADEPAGPLPCGSGRILFVDDDPMLVELGRTMLEEAGYQVFGATDSRQVLERFREDPAAVDLLVTDQTMPGLTGKDLIHEVRTIRPELPTILCTGFSSKISEDEAHRLGIDAFCLKPLELNELLAAVEQALHSSSQH